MGISVLEDGTRVWKPNPGPQEQFLSLPTSVFEAFIGGAVGGGKSESLLADPVARGLTEKQYFKGAIFRKTYPQLEESLIPRSHELYPLFGGKYNSQDKVWKFPSGATIRFRHLEHENDVFEHDTAEFHYLGIDEITHFSEFTYKYIIHRVRSGYDGIPAYVRVSGTPGNIGHTWVRKRFIEPFKQGGRLIYDELSDTYRIFIPAKLTDNPKLLESDPGYLRRLYLLPEAERIAKMDGDWWIFAGQVFTEFRTKRMPDEPARALHVVESFEIPDWWPKILCLDWGYTAMTWAGLLAVAPDTRIFVYNEYARRKQQIEVWCADVARMIQFEQNIKTIVLDPSAWAKRGEKKTIHEQVEEALHRRVERADNDRLGGKLLLHEFLRWTARPPRYVPAEGFNRERADFIYRNLGDKAHNDYVRSFEPDPPETNIPRLQIFDKCQHLIKAISLCEYAEKNKDGVLAEDVKEFDGDDPYDGIRYGLKEADRYLREAKEEAKIRTEREQIINNLATTGDQTAFYRRMELLELRSSVRGQNQPVRLYHRARKSRSPF